MRRTFELFADLLEERLAAKVPTVEDAVRYTFFHALLSSAACRHTEVIIEYPHPVIKSKEIDLLIIPQDSGASSALEFKYDRAIPSEQGINKTNRAGALFNDLLRLAHVPESTATRRYLIYVTDLQMASYFRNPGNRFDSFFELENGEELYVGREFIEGRRPSFTAKVLCPFISFKGIGVYRCNLSEQHFLRIWQIVT